MKKILILALVAIVAGAAFAETDPVFSGSFSTYWGYSFSDSASVEDNSLGMKIDLNATIDDFNTVSVSVGLADAMYWDDVFDDDTIGYTEGVADSGLPFDTTIPDTELDNRGDYLRMNGFTLSTDLTGALGVDAPVSVMTKMGDFGFGTVNVANVAPFSADVVGGSGTDSNVGLGLTVNVMDMVTLGTVLYPVDAFEGKNAETGITLSASGIAGMIDVAAFFIVSEHDLALDPDNIDNYVSRAKAGIVDLDGDGDNTEDWEFVGSDLNDDEGMNMGFSVKAMPIDGLAIGAGFAYDMVNTNNDGETGVAAAQLDLAATMIDGLTAGLSFGIEDFTNFMPSSSVYLSASYAMMDKLTIYGGAGISFASAEDGVDFKLADDVTYDVGLTTSLAALAVQVGVSDNMDYKAPEDDFGDTAYVKFSTSF